MAEYIRITDIPPPYKENNIITVDKLLCTILDRNVLASFIEYFYEIHNNRNVPSRSFILNYNIQQLRLILYNMLLECSREDQLYRISLDYVGSGYYGKLYRKIIDYCRKI